MNIFYRNSYGTGSKLRSIESKYFLQESIVACTTDKNATANNRIFIKIMQQTIVEFSFKNTADTSEYNEIELLILIPKKIYLFIPPNSNRILTIF